VQDHFNAKSHGVAMQHISSQSVALLIGDHHCAVTLRFEVDPVDGTPLIVTAVLDGVIEINRDDLVQMAGATQVQAVEATLMVAA
jgi:hypothetical protein